VCCFVLLTRYWGIFTVPGLFLAWTDLRQPGAAGSSPCTSDCDGTVKGAKVGFFVFFGCYAATQLALQLHQERTQVVCSNREARKRPASLEGTPAMDIEIKGIRTHM